MSQSVIRGIGAVGAVDVKYRYNGPGNKLPVPRTINLVNGADRITNIDTANFIKLAGFLLDQDFLDANPQVASAAVFPVLGGGGVAITNNNRSGVLVVNCARVSTPRPVTAAMMPMTEDPVTHALDGIGVNKDVTDTYDAVLIAQIQQAQRGGGDAYGATILVEFMFSGRKTTLEFQACTVSSVKPITLSGRRPGLYTVSWPYLNWTSTIQTGDAVVAPAEETEYRTVVPTNTWDQ